jgi:hypothetical protein
LKLVKKYIRQFGTSDDDKSSGGCENSQKNVYTIGTTEGDLAGINKGSGDVFIVKYDDSGNIIWSNQMGTSSNDQAVGNALNINNNQLFF